MNFKFQAVLVGCCLAFGPLASQVVLAQAEVHDHADHDHSHNHSGETVDFILAKWKTIHLDDNKQSSEHLDIIKKLGCEIKQGKHGNHIDVTYRCAQWKTMQVPSHELAEQWMTWLKQNGFDASHAHRAPSFAEGNEVVEFRKVEWKSVHGDGAAKEKELIENLTQLGCEVVVSQHTGHSDIKFRAPTWRDIHVADHATADQWMAWLKQNGFEVAPHKH